METLSVHGSSFMSPASAIPVSHRQPCPTKTIRQINIEKMKHHKQTRIVITHAGKSGGFSLNSILKKCENCGGKGAIECEGCKGTGRNKKNGNIFERWKCFECQGFGLKSCPSCGKGGLTPEQRGER